MRNITKHNVVNFKYSAFIENSKEAREWLDLKAQKKQALIDMMRGGEEIGLYDDNPKNH